MGDVAIGLPALAVGSFLTYGAVRVLIAEARQVRHARTLRRRGRTTAATIVSVADHDPESRTRRTVVEFDRPPGVPTRATVDLPWKNRPELVAGAQADVWAIAVAPDSSWYATAGRDTAIRIWETTATHPVATLLGHTDGVAALALSPDGRLLAPDGRLLAPDSRLLASGGYDGTVRIWSPADGWLLATRPMPGQIHALSWLPDGTALAAGTEDGLFLLSIDSD